MMMMTGSTTSAWIAPAPRPLPLERRAAGSRASAIHGLPYIGGGALPSPSPSTAAAAASTSTSTSLSLFDGDIGGIGDMGGALFSSSSELIREFFPDFSALTDAEGEAAMLTDLAHVSSDIVVILEPETVLLRLGVVIGRMLGMTSDYVSDEKIRGDELAFDLPLLWISVLLFWRSAVPLIRARFFTKLDEFDMDAYDQCFAPVGVSLLQFKSMKATGCFERMFVGPGTVLIDENCEVGVGWQYLYWQYDGRVIRSHRGNVFNVAERTRGRNINHPKAVGLLGDSRFLYKLDEHEAETNSNGRPKTLPEADVAASTGKDDDDRPSYPIATATVGGEGATMLRIDSYKLFDLMDHDVRLESSIRRLLLKSLQRKIGNLLRAQEELFSEQRRQQGGGRTAAKMEESTTGTMLTTTGMEVAVAPSGEAKNAMGIDGAPDARNATEIEMVAPPPPPL